MKERGREGGRGKREGKSWGNEVRDREMRVMNDVLLFSLLLLIILSLFPHEFPPTLHTPNPVPAGVGIQYVFPALLCLYGRHACASIEGENKFR